MLQCCNTSSSRPASGLPGCGPNLQATQACFGHAVDHEGPCAWDFNLTVDAEREPHRNRAPRAPRGRPTSESESDSESPVQVTTTSSTQAGSSGSLPTSSWPGTRNLGRTAAAAAWPPAPFAQAAVFRSPDQAPQAPLPGAATGQLLLLVSYISCYLLVLSGGLEPSSGLRP